MRSSRHSNLKTHELFRRLTSENIDKNTKQWIHCFVISFLQVHKKTQPPMTILNLWMMKLNGNKHFHNSNQQIPICNTPSQIVINIKPSNPVQVTPENHNLSFGQPSLQTNFSLRYFINNHSSTSNMSSLKSKHAFLQLLAQKVSEKMKKINWYGPMTLNFEFLSCEACFWIIWSTIVSTVFLQIQNFCYSICLSNLVCPCFVMDFYSRR